MSGLAWAAAKSDGTLKRSVSTTAATETGIEASSIAPGTSSCSSRPNSRDAQPALVIGRQEARVNHNTVVYQYRLC